jgi:7-cyano-7-deazaguanine synthase
MNTTVLLWSGGLDSTVLLYYLLKQEKKRVYPLFIEYGQNTYKQEREACIQIYSKLKYENAQSNIEVPKLLDASHLFESMNQTSSLLIRDQSTTKIQTTDDITVDTYRDNFVAYRNMLFLNLAAMYANSKHIESVTIGTIQSEYPDAQSEFIGVMNSALYVSCHNRSGHQYTTSIQHIDAPFRELTKEDIVHAADDYGVPIDMTWSCYNNQDQQCGECVPCVKIKEAKAKLII